MNKKKAPGYTERVIRLKGIRKPYQGVVDTANAVVAKQLELIDCLITQLENHELFSNTLVGGSSTYVYTISLRTKYPNSRIKLIKVNFNRFNMSLHLRDHSGDLHLGTFRFKTSATKDDGTMGTITSPFHFTNDDDTRMIEELKLVFYETEQIYAESEHRLESYEKNDKIDLNTIKFVDLCKLYCGNISLSVRLSSLIYDGKKIVDMTAMEFYKEIDLDKLKDLPRIGPKSIAIIKNMYVFYEFPKD
jgi:hypothetical protein